MERTQIFPKLPRDIRKQHKIIRQEMTREEVAIASEVICEKLLNSSWYEQSTWIYGYYPLGNEVDCRSFLQKALADRKHVALPRMLSQDLMRKDEANDYAGQDECVMDFYEIHSLEQVQTGGFCVMEPTENCSLVTNEEAVVLVPGVVFDKSGNRYGYGKGYYDRYFARFPALYRVGLAYENQIEEKLAVKEFDIRMNEVCTES